MVAVELVGAKVARDRSNCHDDHIHYPAPRVKEDSLQLRMWRRRCTNIVLVKHLLPEADNLTLVFDAGPDSEVNHEDHGFPFQDALDDGEVLASWTFEDLVVLVGVLGDHRLDLRVYVGVLPRLGGANLANVVLVKCYLQVLWLNVPDRHTWLSV